jgi:PIN domain nuclease of toxin-antitoxin system
MRVLIDTHILLWFQSLDPKLSASTRQRIELSPDDHFVSQASLWEIAIKHSIGKLTLDRDLPTTFALIEEAGFSILPLERTHILALSTLPLHHRDPFDRMLIAQAKAEGMHIITADPHFGAYEVPLAG